MRDMVDTMVLPPRMPRNAAQPLIATDRQLNFIDKLIGERADAGLLPDGFEADVDAKMADGLTGKGASALIDALLAIKLPKGQGATAMAADLEPGMYRKGETFYRVRRSKAGNWYAQELRRAESGGITFKYVGKVRGLVAEHRITLDEARQFGIETGACICCGAELTDPKSIEAGIGPVCAKRV